MQKPNGATQPAVELGVASAEQPVTEYTFTALESGFFQAHIHAVNAGIDLLAKQKGLPGSWRLKADFSGIERADLPPMMLSRA